MPDESPYDSIPEADVATGRILASVAYLPALCFVGLFAAPGNRYVGFHARQGLLLFLTEIVGAVAISMFDASLGGLGGCPFAPGASGNVVTEDLVFMFEAMGVRTGIDLERLIAARGPLQAGLPGEPLYGMTPQAGPPKAFMQGAARV